MKGKGRKILFAICVIVAGIAIGYLILYYTKLVKNEKKYDEVVKEVVKEEVKKEPQEDAYTSPIDFKKLQEQNPDVYAWIEIPGTNVNYPIMRHPTDDAYYLDHTIDGTAGLPGSIYTENYNNKEFTDFNTVIYGHDMRDGTMFKDLHKYEDEEFFKRASGSCYLYARGKKWYTMYLQQLFTMTDILCTHLTFHRKIKDRCF